MEDLYMQSILKCYFVIYKSNDSKIKYKFISTDNRNKIFLKHNVIYIVAITKRILNTSNDQVICFFLYLQFQINNGISIKNAIQNFIMSSNDFKLLFYVKSIRRKLNTGMSFAESVEELIDINAFNLVKNLETTGDVAAILSYIVDYYRLKNELHATILRKLRIPLISFFFIIILMGGIIAYIAPMVIQVTRNNTITNFVIFYNIFFAMVFVYYIYINFVSKKLILSDPVVGKIILKSNLWVFSYNLKLCLKAKLNLLKSISISALSTPNIVIKNKLLFVLDKIQHGESFSHAIKNERIFKGMFNDAIMIGEKNNSLQLTMEKLSSKLYSELLLDLEKLTSNLSIFLNVFSGIILSTILLNIIGPIYDLVEKIDYM